MFEKYVQLFLVVSCCILLFGVFNIWHYLRKNSTSFKSNKTVSNLFGALSDIYLVIDGAGFVADVNSAFKNTFADFKIQVPNTLFEDVVHYLESITTEKNPEDIYWMLLTHKRAVHSAEVTITKDGNSFHYLVSKDIITERGGYAGFVVTLTDISDYRKKHDEFNAKNLLDMKKADESDFDAKSSFLADILSHEIRTPMNVIIGTTEAIRASADLGKVSEGLDKISVAAKHLSRTINNALDMSSLEAKKFTLYEEAFAFEDMIRNVATKGEASAKKKKQSFKIIIDKNIPSVLISDELRLSQVINNLLSNAVRYTPFNGNIEFAVKLLSRKNQSVRLQFAVKDDGIGVSEAMKAKLFNTFKQTASGYSRQYKATAMGLAISQRIVGLLGGVIRVESDPGRGSVFTFEIDVRFPSEQTISDIKPTDLRAMEEKEAYDFSGHTILLDSLENQWIVFLF